MTQGTLVYELSLKYLFLDTVHCLYEQGTGLLHFEGWLVGSLTH